MSGEVVQAHYEQLEGIARRFGNRAQTNAELQRRVLHAVQSLRNGGWQGRGSAAFFAEMDGKVMPVLTRLVVALNEAQRSTLAIKQIIQQAEEEAARVFQGQSVSIPGVADRVLTGASATGVQESGFTPLSPWLTAPFASGAVVLGPGGVPVLGPWGRIPPGYSNAGSRLWLYNCYERVHGSACAICQRLCERTWPD